MMNDSKNTKMTWTMTKEIQKLAEFAGYNGHYCTEELDLDMFAELIIKKCAGLVQGVPTDSMGYHTADQKIKQYFGLDK